MKKIALTGNIAAGKSSVEKIIKELGYKVLDTDTVCHKLLAENFKVINKIKNEFVSFDILNEKEQLCRKKLGEIVFNNDLMRKKLENILHPEIISQINIFCELNSSENLIFVSVPLLFEAKMEKTFDKIILICADEQIRLTRLIHRNNYSKEYALKRIHAQEKEEIKKNKSDFIINNNGIIDELKPQIQNIINSLMNN